MAIASLILGILAIPGMCVCYGGLPLAILAFIFGAMGLRGRNRGMAIAGMICAGIAMLVVVVLVIIGLSMGQLGKG